MTKTSKHGLTLVMLLLAIGLCYADSSSFVGDINITPNPMEKNAVINVNFLHKVEAEIVIETLDGMVVKTLYSGDFSVGTYEFFWNRLDDNGEFVPSGEYFVSVNYQIRYTSTKKTIILK